MLKKKKAKRPTAEDMWQQATEEIEACSGLARYVQKKMCEDSGSPSSEGSVGCRGLACEDCPFDMGTKEFVAELKRRLKK